MAGLYIVYPILLLLRIAGKVEYYVNYALTFGRVYLIPISESGGEVI